MTSDDRRESRADGVCAVVVTYRPDPDFSRRLELIRLQADHVVVVDNGSDAALHSGARGQAEVLSQNDNVGLAAALNIGLQRAMALGFRWVVTFDQDSTPFPGMVAALLATRARQPDPDRVAVVGPRLKEERVVHEDHRWVRPHPRLKWLFQRAPCREGDLTGVAFVITSGALMDLRIFRRIGPMDEALFIDYIDHDYCLRARRAGYDLVVSQGALLLHNLGAKREFTVAGRSVRPTFHSALRLHYMFRNRIRVLRRHALRHPHWALFDCVYTPLNLARVLFWEDQRMRKLAAAVRGTVDGLLGRTGRVR